LVQTFRTLFLFLKVALLVEFVTTFLGPGLLLPGFGKTFGGACLDPFDMLLLLLLLLLEEATLVMGSDRGGGEHEALDSCVVQFKGLFEICCEKKYLSYF